MGSLTFISKHSLAGMPQPETVRTPEIEKGVGCDFDSYLLLPDSSLDDRIAAAKAKLGKDAVILGHHYQRDEVVKFADLRGDSLKLSRQAAEAEGKYIVFCGVHFMAESTDILRRDRQIVVLPDLSAGCSMGPQRVRLHDDVFESRHNTCRGPSSIWARENREPDFRGRTDPTLRQG